MAAPDEVKFNRRYAAWLALGPFLVTTLVSVVLGRLPAAMWGYPLWSVAPLLALLWLGPVTQPQRLGRFALGFVAIFATYPLAYAGIEKFEPFVRDRPKATQFPGAATAAAITNAWHSQHDAPLVYVCGSEFEANNVAVYSPDKPRVMPHCDPALSPWIDVNDVQRRGIAVVYSQTLVAPASLERWRATFGPFEVGPPLVLPRQTLHQVKPAKILYGFVAPRMP